MTSFGLTIPVGLGDAILISAALNNVKNRFDKINININSNFVARYKNNDQKYFDFYISLLKLLLHDPKFIINDKSKNFPNMNIRDVKASGIPVVLPKFSNELCDNKYNNIIQCDKYIVITTKVRELNRCFYNGIKNNFLKTIKRLSKKYKVVVIGEREIEMNSEYKIHGDKKIYSIYYDIKNLGIDFIDMTVPKLGITAPDIGNIQRDCTIMNGANGVITFGCGGNFILSLATSKNPIGFRIDNYNFLDKILIPTDIVRSGDSFIKSLISL